MMKYAVVTFGCRVNQADSLSFEEELIGAGARPTRPEEADVVIVNTCTVTASADQGARQVIRRIARDNPRVRIVVTGCYATRRPDESQALPNVLRVIKNENKAEVASLVLADLADVTTAHRYGAGEGSCGAIIEPGLAGRTAFTLRVQTGCGERCAYCIIPTTRGAPRSIPIDRVLLDVNRVVGAGFKEIALTGVHLGSYGRDLAPARSLYELLVALGSWRAQPVSLRISSLEPMDCSTDIIDLVAANSRFAPHFHLPLQHASPSVLARMARPYSIDYYAELVSGIRRRIPDASIGSDVIAGFPGETEQDVDDLLRYLETCPLTHLHVFPYSDRPGTTAASMRDKVPGAAIRDRAARIRAVGSRLAARFRASQIGRVRRGLTIDDGTVVMTDNYLKVRIAPGCSRNEWVDVRLTEDGDPPQGEIVGELSGNRREVVRGRGVTG